MKIEPTERPADFEVKPHIWASFDGPAKFCRVSGRGGLVRFVREPKFMTDDERKKGPGDCWFDERLFSTLRQRVKAELNAQFRSAKSRVPVRGYVGLGLRICLRQDLAVSMNWNAFECYAVLPLRPQDSIVALVGRIAPQPAYSEDYADKLPVGLPPIQLPGGEQQFIVDFDCQANQEAKQRVLGPFPF